MKIVKGRQSRGNLPGTKALNDCMQTLTTPEGAEYARDQFEAILKQAGMMTDAVYQKALAVFNDFAKYVGLASSGGDPWSGKIPPTGFQNVQQGLANESAVQINVEKPIRLDFAISDKSQFVKAWTVEGKTVDARTEKAMNEQLLAWLASDKNPKSTNEGEKLQVVNHDGTLYALDSKEADRIKKQDGKPVLADPKAIEKAFADPKHGFAQFVQKANSAAEVTIYSHDYAANQPEKTQTAQIQAGG